MLALAGVAQATEIGSAFQKKQYKRVTEIYRQNPEANFATKDLIYISYSLQRLGFYRQDLILSGRLINRNHKKDHLKLINSLRKGKTIDADEYPKQLKILYWNMLTAYVKIIEGYNQLSDLSVKDQKRMTIYGKILGELEFRESKVDKLTDRIQGHILYLQNKIYKRVSNFSFQYVSWQQQSTLEGSDRSASSLIVTNKGYCLGGDTGYENHLWHFYLDGCLFAGSGGVQSKNGSAVNYQQSVVMAYGLKAGPGASMIVSSSRSRIGFKLPVIYNIQNLTDPGTRDGVTYQVTTKKPLSVALTLYSRWQFDKWFINTEFGQYVAEEQTFWGLGFGKSF
jgi:hypothetical protein